MTQTIPVELIVFSGEHLISELDDIDGLIRLYKPKVFRFVAFSVADRDAAESITQDCFLKAHLTFSRLISAEINFEAIAA